MKYIYPDLSLLDSKNNMNGNEIEKNKKILEELFKTFNVKITISNIVKGPIISRFDIHPEPGTRIGKITSLKRDLSVALKNANIRFIVPVPETDTIGIEIPNDTKNTIQFRDVIGPALISSRSPLEIGIGLKPDGIPLTLDARNLTHMLIAGTSGSGKSIFLHSLINSILFSASPEHARLVLIDPKKVEFSIYSLLPHVYDPSSENQSTIKELDHAVRTLSALVDVMKERYNKLLSMNCRDLIEYNGIILERRHRIEPDIYVIIDEFADLMMLYENDIKESVTQLSQMARAVGIHLIFATQRPSADVVTGIIKANFSTRIAFQTVSGIDSRIILDVNGAENLLGNGDMLYSSAECGIPIRLHGAFISKKEISNIVSFINNQNIQKTNIHTKEDEDKSISSEELNELLSFIAKNDFLSYRDLCVFYSSPVYANKMYDWLSDNDYLDTNSGINIRRVNKNKLINI